MEELIVKKIMETKVNKTIWKFELESIDFQKIEMPIDSEILTIQIQKETLCLWAVVNPEAEKETRRFQVIGTGHQIIVEGNIRNYIGTYQLYHGDLIFHVFEII